MLVNLQMRDHFWRKLLIYFIIFVSSHRSQLQAFKALANSIRRLAALNINLRSMRDPMLPDLKLPSGVRATHLLALRVVHF